jgi:hypothetical protein
LIRCEKPFALAKGVKPQWQDRKDNAVWSMEDCPSLPRAGAGGKLDLTKLPQLWKNHPHFPPIPVEKIGLSGLR